MGGRKWAAGQAIPDLGVILIAATPGPEGIEDLEKTIPHELTHVLLYQRLGDSYQNLPDWLEEGLATSQEGVPNPDYALSLERAFESNTLIPLETLCAAFPATPDDALLAYAESASLVTYIKDIYGSGAILALLDAYQEGTTCTGGLQRILRRSPRQLEAEWKRASFEYSNPAEIFRPILPWALLLLPTALILLLVVLQAVIRRRGDPGQ